MAAPLGASGDACWRVADSFSLGGVDLVPQGTSKPKFAEKLAFVSWGRPPPSNTNCSWLPEGQPAFDLPIRFPEGLELRLKLYGKDIVARTSVSRSPRESGSVSPLIHWEILEVTSDLGILSPLVDPTAGPMPGPAFKALMLTLGKPTSAYRKLQLRQLLGFHDVLVLAHIDHAFRGGRGPWRMPAKFLLRQQKFLHPADLFRLNNASPVLKGNLQDIIPPADENTSPSGLHTPTVMSSSNDVVLQRLMLGRDKQQQIQTDALQMRHMNLPRVPETPCSLGIKLPVPQCQQVLQDYMDGSGHGQQTQNPAPPSPAPSPGTQAAGAAKHPASQQHNQGQQQSLSALFRSTAAQLRPAAPNSLGVPSTPAEIQLCPEAQYNVGILLTPASA